MSPKTGFASLHSTLSSQYVCNICLLDCLWCVVMSSEHSVEFLEVCLVRPSRRSGSQLGFGWVGGFPERNENEKRVKKKSERCRNSPPPERMIGNIMTSTTARTKRLLPPLLYYMVIPSIQRCTCTLYHLQRLPLRELCYIINAWLCDTSPLMNTKQNTSHLYCCVSSNYSCLRGLFFCSQLKFPPPAYANACFLFAYMRGQIKKRFGTRIFWGATPTSRAAGSQCRRQPGPAGAARTSPRPGGTRYLLHKYCRRWYEHVSVRACSRH